MLLKAHQFLLNHQSSLHGIPHDSHFWLNMKQFSSKGGKPSINFMKLSNCQIFSFRLFQVRYLANFGQCASVYFKSSGAPNILICSFPFTPGDARQCLISTYMWHKFEMKEISEYNRNTEKLMFLSIILKTKMRILILHNRVRL